MTNRNSYKCIRNFGPNTYSPVNNPVTYCMGQTLENNFLHGSTANYYSQHAPICQAYLSEYCANGWDGFCEFASNNENRTYPNSNQYWNMPSQVGCTQNLTAGEVLIRNTAANKYLVEMIGAVKKYQPFDPNVATSPMVGTWVSTDPNSMQPGIPVYAVDPKVIDDDLVMNKILANPNIAPDILINIYNTMKRNNVIGQLKGTKLGQFYENVPYFKTRGGLSS